MDWSADQVEVLKRMVAEQCRASEIGAVLGRTKGSVLGKMLRLGISSMFLPGGSCELRSKPVASSIPIVPRPVAPQLRIVVTPFVEPPPKPRYGKLVHLLDLGPTDCRWPIGDPRSAGFGFCGRKTSRLYGYCKEHHKEAYVGR